MGQNSNIAWTDNTFNPVRGCTKISPGCAQCYAAREALRFPNMRGIWGDKGTRIVASDATWKLPRRWNKTMPGARVFCASLADVFEDWQGELHYPDKEKGIEAAWWRQSMGIIRAGKATAGFVDGERMARMSDLRNQLFALIEQTPRLTWQLLTKRPENVMRMVPAAWHYGFPANVQMGTTVEDQTRVDERLPELMKIPAQVRFLSCEPMLEAIDLRGYLGGYCSWETTGKGPFVNWLICGGESGRQARKFDLRWARSLRDQCKAAGVPFFMKQVGSLPVDSGGETIADRFALGIKDRSGANVAEFPADLQIQEFPALYHEYEVATSGEKPEDHAASRHDRRVNSNQH